MSGQTVGWQLGEGDETELIAITVAGFAAGIGFGITLAVLGILESVGHLVGTSGLLVGVPLVILASVIGAFVYRAMGTLEPLAEDVTDPITGATIGTCFGLTIWIVGVVLLVPLWLRLLGRTPPVPFLHWQSLIGLVVYGALLGPLYPLIKTQMQQSVR